MPLLELRNVESYYGNVQALKGISLKVERGEVVTLPYLFEPDLGVEDWERLSNELERRL